MSNALDPIQPGIRAKSRLLRFGSLIGLLAASPCLAQIAPITNRIRADFWTVNGPVHAILETNGTVYVGGEFSYAAPRQEKALLLDLHSASADPAFPAVHGAAIHAIIEDGAGGWFIGGSFDVVGGAMRSNLVHISMGNRVDPDFHPDPNGVVHALTRVGETLFVGGAFNFLAGQPRSNLAAFNLSEQKLSLWNPAANGPVFCLLAGPDALFAGGAFTQIGGQLRRKIAAVDFVTAQANGWNPVAFGDVLTLALADDNLIAGGSFTSIGGELRNGLAALNTQTSQATSWDPNPRGGKVHVVRVLCDGVYVGGAFTNLAGAGRARVGAVDIHSAQILPWDPQLDPRQPGGEDSFVADMALSADTLYLAGSFSSVGGRARAGLAALTIHDGALLPWAPQTTGGVTAIATAGRQLLAGLAVASGAVERRNLAAFDSLTGEVTDWNPGADGPVLALSAAAGRVFAGGKFHQIGTYPAEHIAAIDRLTGQAIWSAQASDDVNALAADDTRLFLGGRFTMVNGQTRWRLAALDLSTGALEATWIAQADGTVDTFFLSLTTLYVGGNFITIAGQDRHRLAALTSSTGGLLPWNPNANQRVRSLAFANNRVLAGGEFTEISGAPRPYLAALHPSDGHLLPFGAIPDAPVQALAFTTSGDLFVGGSFLTVDGLPRIGLARLDALGQLASWAPDGSAAKQVLALLPIQTGLLVGGATLIDSTQRSLAHYGLAGAPVVDSVPEQTVLAGQRVVFTSQAQGLAPLNYQWRFEGTNLPGETEPALEIAAASLEHAGRYTLLVTNAAGGGAAQTRLSVFEPVAITSAPADISAPPGSNIILTVAATGSPSPIYQWRRNGVNIPGAVFPTLVIPEAQPAHGGSYQVVVANSIGALISPVARVLISAPALPFSDNRDAAGLIIGEGGVGAGNNTGATTENNEPLHAGKAGGSSLWLQWLAPANGAASFYTLGSGFDTLLAIYSIRDDSLALLTEAADDDRGGLLTSRAVFNALAGKTYWIAIDGLGGAEGSIVLSWFLDSLSTPFPRIITQPLGQSVVMGDTVEFSVQVLSPTPVTYQWFMDCRELIGETSSILTLPNVQSRHVGSYRVVARNASDFPAESLGAALELGPAPNIQSVDKLEDALQDVLAPNGGQGGNGGFGALLLGYGSIISQTFDTTRDTTSLGEPNPCGVAGGASAWLPFRAQAPGIILVDTVGSAFDTLLSVYHPTNSSQLASAIVACDNDGAPDGIRSLVRFETAGDTTYLAVVDGVNGARGQARINWRHGAAPVLDPTPTNPLAMTSYAGADLTLVGPAVIGGLPPPAFQWELNGILLAGATNQNLVLRQLQPAQAGAYTLVASNFAGLARGAVGMVTIKIPFHFQQISLDEDTFRARVLGEPGDWFILEASFDLLEWETMTTAQLAPTGLDVAEAVAAAPLRRFYRVRPTSAP